MDFFRVREREGGTQKKPVLEVYPDFKVVRSKDLMVRGKSFYAIWDEKKGLWVTDEYEAARLVDEEVRKYETTTTGYTEVKRKYMNDFESRTWLQFQNYMAHLTDHFVQLDETITFKNTEVKKEDYVSRRLPYDLTPGDYSAWDELVSTLYNPEERKKIEWAIGAVLTGDSKSIQKFIVLYGPMGSGKSTIMNIIQMLTEGYFAAFVAKELTQTNNAFALEAFKTNPLVAIEHDGDLSKIQDNTRLNSLVSHEWMLINEKNKPTYTARFNAMMFIGSNNPVKITDGKSGLIRRLIDVHPSGKLLSVRKYQSLMNQIKFELGAIAQHCVDTYREMGKEYYSGYRPTEMMMQTDVFFNFIEDSYETFLSQDGVTLTQAFMMYKEFIKDSDLEYSLSRMKFREELKNYFTSYEDRAIVDGDRVRSWYSGFTSNRFKVPTGKPEEQHMFSLVLEETESIFDKTFAKTLAQYSNKDGNPTLYWDGSERQRINKRTGESEMFFPEEDAINKLRLKDLDTTKEHYVKVPEHHIVIDFDITGPDGQKSAQANLEAASQWPPTYAEFSKSGAGIHLHYNYTGDPSELSAVYGDGIEVKVYRGNSALRRRLSFCNNVPIADISDGLPLKEKKLIDEKRINDEAHLRNLINKGLQKKVHAGTKSNVDYIAMVLDEAYKGGVSYNVTDMRQRVLNFAMGSTNQAIEAMRVVQSMKWASEDAIEAIQDGTAPETPVKNQKTLDADSEVIFDVEVYPNLFVICWKYSGAPDDSVVTMINPTQREVEKLLSMKLVGFYNRQYDNHIIYAAAMGYTIEQLYILSQKLIDDATSRNAKFGAAYDLSYADIYDVAAIKMSLKKWQIELGLTHVEMSIPWDKPVPKERVQDVASYCANDVNTTDAVRHHLEADFIARAILADLSGLTMNSTTQQHTARLLFGDNRNPQSEFVYTDLSEMFPGYKFGYNQDKKKMESTYRDFDTGEGGFVYAEPGVYENVEVFDVESMHPTSIEALNAFGKYTQKFSELLEARLAIKNGDYDKARQLFGGKLARYLNDESLADALAYALKIVINIVYGLTSARFQNSFKDPRNIDNIVAKRGALFMIELLLAVREKGFNVLHIKTDSIKVANPTEELRQFIKDFGKQYGYNFVHEVTYDKFCLVNKAVYIAHVAWAIKAKKIDTWEAVGKQFQHPFVFKTLFTGEPIRFEDKCEARSVKQGTMYIDYTGIDDTPMALAAELDENNMRFVGKTGLFTPMEPGNGAGFLIRVHEGKHYAVSETKGWQWLESEIVKANKKQNQVDMSYFRKLTDDAKAQINNFGDYEAFVG